MRWTGILKFIFVADSYDQAVAESFEHVKMYLAKAAYANAAEYTSPDDVGEVRIEEWMKNAAIVGSVQTVCDRLQPFWEAGTQHILAWLRFGHMPHWLVTRNMRIFMEKVVPQFA
jgi:alkanesulfonate monooxygenase SsuD/methylene tetrahydromethanopterin reductase-like flavin-dependent oxidoreductase (luciferase family)